MSFPVGRFISSGLLFVVITGCAMGPRRQTGNSTSNPSEMAHVQNPNSVIAESRLAPGHYCRINTSLNGPQSLAGQSNDGVNLAGRIVAMDENRIVLGDVICISKEPAIATGEPDTTKEKGAWFLSRFASRRFKKSGTGHRSIPVDGEIAIDRSTISMISPVDGTNWEVSRQSGQWFERIGVSFDFNDGSQQARMEVAREVPRADAATDQSDDFQFASIPPAKTYDPTAENIQSSSLTKDLRRQPERQTYMSVEAINSQMSGAR